MQRGGAEHGIELQDAEFTHPFRTHQVCIDLAQSPAHIL